MKCARKVQFSSFVPIKGINKKLFILSRLNAFRTVVCILMFRVKGPYSALGHCTSINVHQTLMDTNESKIWSSGVYI